MEGPGGRTLSYLGSSPDHTTLSHQQSPVEARPTGRSDATNLRTGMAGNKYGGANAGRGATSELRGHPGAKGALDGPQNCDASSGLGQL